MNEAQEKELLANVASLTDHKRMVDEVFKQLKLGRKMELVFRCGHSGLFYRGDFLRGWGKTYGIGQGPDPKSEVLDSDYDTPLPLITRDIRDIKQIAFGVQVSGAQVDAQLADVEAITRANQWVIPALDDPYMEERMAIVRPRQLKNPRGSALLAIQTEWARQGGKS